MTKRQKGWPPYSTQKADGRRRLQYPDPDRPGRKLSITSVLPGEPAEGYSDPAVAWVAYRALEQALTDRKDYTQTVAGFAERWTDDRRSPWRADAIDGGDRSDQTLSTLRSHVARFVRLHGAVPMAAITREQHVQRYLDLGSEPNEKPIARTSLAALSLMWKDAASEKGGQIVQRNPFDQLARRVAKQDNARRDKAGIQAPTDEQAISLLDAVYAGHPFPIGLAGWLEFGQETGLRCGELDAVRLSRLYTVDGVLYYDVVEQWHAHNKQFSQPKWGSFRQIPLSPRAVEIVDTMTPIAASLASDFLFNTKDGEHLSDGYRDRYWTARGESFTGLRTHVDGVQMKNATRHYFATTQLRKHNQAMLAGERAVPIPLIAEYMGHRDGGETLRKHYAKTYEQDMQRGMAQAFSDQASVVSLSTARRKRAA